MYRFLEYLILALMLDSLVRVSRRVEFKSIAISQRIQKFCHTTNMHEYYIKLWLLIVHLQLL